MFVAFAFVVISRLNYHNFLLFSLFFAIFCKRGRKVVLVLKRGFGSSLKFSDFEEREFWPLRGFLTLVADQGHFVPLFPLLCDRDITGTLELA